MGLEQRVLQRQQQKLVVLLVLLAISAILLAIMWRNSVLAEPVDSHAASPVIPVAETPSNFALFPPRARPDNSGLIVQGKAKPGETVMLALNGDVQTTAVADCDGAWQGQLPLWRDGSQVVTAIRGNHCQAELGKTEKLYLGGVAKPSEQMRVQSVDQLRRLKAIKVLLEESFPNRFMADGRLLLTIPAIRLFNSDDVATTKGNELLQTLALNLRGDEHLTWQIMTHTDNQDETVANLERSQRWLSHVIERLTMYGVRPAQLQHHAYGDTRPLNTNRNAKEQALNRRLNVIIGY